MVCKRVHSCLALIDILYFEKQSFPLQAGCARTAHKIGQSVACDVNMHGRSFNNTGSNSQAEDISRRLSIQPFEQVIKTAMNGIALIAYQDQLVAAKRRQNDKSQLRKVTEQSKCKLQEIHAAAQKVCPHVT